MKLRGFKRKKTFKVSFFLAGLVFFLLLSLFLIWKSNFFSVKNIEVVVDKISCATDQQIKTSSALQGQNIFLVDSAKTEKSLMENFLCIKKIHLSKSVPNSIKLEVMGREALARLVPVKLEASSSALLEEIATPSADIAADIYLVDEEGKIFSKDPLEITKINVVGQNLLLGMMVNNSLKGSLKILEDLKKIGVTPLEFTVTDNFLIAHNIPRIIFGLREDIDLQIASLQLILNKAKIDDISLEFIDLRFDKPIIRFAPKKNG